MTSRGATPALPTGDSGDVPGGWYAATLLGVAGALSQIDRQIMGLLLEPVKLDLQLSDVQMSLLYGLAFVLFHTLAALPLGYLADRLPRRSLIAVSVVLWSLATASCGLARTFAQLFAARMAVGVGESTLQPATQSLLPDYFSARSLPTAFAVVQTGVLLGGGTAYVLGAAILALAGPEPVSLPVIGLLRPWQLTFLLVALPGPLVALMMFTAKEPPRRVNRLAGDATGDGFRAFLTQRRAFLASHVGMVAVTSILAFGVLAWTPSFLIRTFRWTPVEAGMRYGLVLMGAGGAGTVLGSLLARRWAASGRGDAPVRVNLLALALGAISAVAFPLVAAPLVALACLAAFSFGVGVTSTMMPTILQLATPHAFRGRLGALYVFATSAIGAALGPVLVATVNQHVLGGTGSLHFAIALVCGVAGPVAIGLNLWCLREFRRIVAAGSG